MFCPTELTVVTLPVNSVQFSCSTETKNYSKSLLFKRILETYMLNIIKNMRI